MNLFLPKQHLADEEELEKFHKSWLQGQSTVSFSPDFPKLTIFYSDGNYFTVLQLLNDELHLGVWAAASKRDLCRWQSDLFSLQVFLPKQLSVGWSGCLCPHMRSARSSQLDEEDQDSSLGSSLCLCQLICVVQLLFGRPSAWMLGLALTAPQCLIASITYTRAF